MTREEAIKELKIIREDYWDEYNDPMPALDMAIKALEQEPCEDAISREDAITKVAIFYTNCERLNMFRHTPNEVKQTVADILSDLPPVQPKPKTGHWIISKDKSHARCSKCSFLLKDKDEIELFGTFIQGYRHCPYCGVRMIEPQAESEE